MNPPPFKIAPELTVALEVLNEAINLGLNTLPPRMRGAAIQQQQAALNLIMQALATPAPAPAQLVPALAALATVDPLA